MNPTPRFQILALHGFTGLGADFKPFSDLCGGNWLCPNLPGHGADPSLECTPEAIVRFIQSQVSSPGPKPSVLLGYSMGARAALLHACAYPKSWDALVLISPNPGIEEASKRAERRQVDERLAERVENEGVANFLDFWQNTPMIRSQKSIRSDWREVMQAGRKDHSPEGLAASLRQFGQAQCPNLWPELSNLELPILLVSGTCDRKYTRIAERISRCMSESQTSRAQIQHALIQGAGHMPHLERPEESAEIITQFMNSLGSQAARARVTLM